MEKIEMKELFDELYEKMSKSNRVENMKVFGNVLKEMMEYFIEEAPADAESYLETLSAVKWRNYLTCEEAESILDNMKPVAPWDYNTFRESIESVGGKIEQCPYYNSCALWVVMSMIYSDSGSTIASLLGGDLDSVSKEALWKAIYRLALDKLKDEDEVFSVRTYFDV